MKEITYSDRAYFYYEETYSDIDHSFLRDIIQLYSINSVLDIPCGAGRNLNMLAQSCELAMFCDIEDNMVYQVKNRIKTSNLRNCRCFRADINNYHLQDKVDMTIVMRQALQLFPPGKINSILENLLFNTSKILILDIYNFKQNTKTGQIPEYLQEKVRVFKFNNQTITRNLELEILDEGIMVNYIYQTSINKWNTQFKLYDISAVFIKQLLGSKTIFWFGIELVNGNDVEKKLMSFEYACNWNSLSGYVCALVAEWCLNDEISKGKAYNLDEIEGIQKFIESLPGEIKQNIVKL